MVDNGTYRIDLSESGKTCWCGKPATIGEYTVVADGESVGENGERWAQHKVIKRRAACSEEHLLVYNALVESFIETLESLGIRNGQFNLENGSTSG